jgi:hypothetical protein
MTIEKTEIVKTKDIDRFFYVLYLKEKQSEQMTQIFRSRGTILERPCWRDDPATFMINNPLDEFIVRVMALQRMKSRIETPEVVIDEVSLPNLLLDHKSHFISQSDLEFKVTG